MTTFVKSPNDQPPGLICPNCGAKGSAKLTDGPESVEDREETLIPAVCDVCGHEWRAKIEPILSGQTIQPVSGDRELTTSPILEEQIDRPISESGIRISELEKGIHRKANLAIIPLPIFWGIIVLVVILVGVGGWLFGELQSQRTADATSEAVRAAQILVRATEIAEARKTATQQMADREATGTAETRQELAVTATVVQAATSAAATITAEFRATSTAERVATANTESTVSAQKASTATAERKSTAEAIETTTAEHRATSTAQYIATLDAQTTGTAEWKATATAENAATLAMIATTTAEQQATATTEKAATIAVVATTTAEWKATATAEAGATPGPPELNVAILGCDTGLDITRGLGEVKNAWVTVQNFGEANVHNVKIVLSASDEEIAHPDKEKFVNVIPPDHQYSDKLTVDSDFGFGSTIMVTVTSDETEPILVTRGQCRVLDENAKRLIAEAGKLGVIVVAKKLGL